MKTINQHLKEKYNLSNYQIAQLGFLIKTLSSEVSKMILMAIFFHKHLPFYFFALFIMLILRCNTGGIHFYTYIGCFITSTLFLLFGIILLPNITIPLNIKILLLLLCIITCYHIGPIPSKYRPSYSKEFIQKCKEKVSTFIFFFSVLLYIIPESQYLIIGFWIIILHTLQLIIAKYARKEVA